MSELMRLVEELSKPGCCNEDCQYGNPNAPDEQTLYPCYCWRSKLPALRAEAERVEAATKEIRTALWRYHYSDDEIEKAYQEEIKPREIEKERP